MRRRLPFLVLLLGVVAGCGDEQGSGAVAPDAGAAPDAGGPALAAQPAGYDAYRQWDRLPELRFGVRAYMRSTYDRAGGNEAADASHFLRQDAPDRNVALDVEGPGVLYFARANHWHGSPWHYEVDGTDNVVSETSTATPDAPAAGSVFLPAGAFPAPLAVTWSLTHGADLSWVPVPFRSALNLSYERTHYGTGYFIYHQFPDDPTQAPQPFSSWSAADAPPKDVLDWIGRAGEDIGPSGAGVRALTGSLSVSAGETVLLARLGDGPATVRALQLTVPQAQAEAFAQATLRITWDDRSSPSVDAPVPLFFGTGSLFNRAGAEYLVRALMANVRFHDGVITFAMYYPMPYSTGARVELVGGAQPVSPVGWELRTVPVASGQNPVGYFHATYRDHGLPIPGHDLVLLDTQAEEGGGSWCGSFVGTSFIFSDRAVLSTLEGDPRFFFDDSQTPQAYGTGTEEWAGGGDYWGGQTMTLPFAGHPVGAPSAAAAINAEDPVESAYRFLVADLMPFGRNARLQLEHGGLDDSTEHYRSVAYWYGRPGACLVPTDALHVGDAADEAAHGYVSGTASAVEAITSRYEWGVDHLNGVEIYPATTDTGRHMHGDTELTLAVDPRNVGVLLRRKLDYQLADQRAEVFVADAAGGAFEPAGVWYLAGSNACVYSNPALELGAAEPVVETSNRRFRDDELLLPPRLTAGRSAIRLRIRFAPRGNPFTAGVPTADTGWSELRYTAYSYVVPP